MQNDRILFEEWRDHNARILYPFADHVTLENDDGIVIPNELFLDARIHPIGGEVGMFLSSIEVEGTTATFTVSGPIAGVLATAIFDAAVPVDDLEVVDTYGRPAGVLISTQTQLTSLIGSYGPGKFDFTQLQTEFVASVAIPLPDTGLRGFLLDDGNVVYGDVYLVGVDGIVLSVEDGVIRVDALGDPYALKKSCDDEEAPLPTFCGIKSINGIIPDDNGDFKISAGGNVAEDTILRVNVETGLLRFEQVCTDRLGLTNA